MQVIYSLSSILKMPERQDLATRQAAREVVANNSRDVDEEWLFLEVLDLQ